MATETRVKRTLKFEPDSGDDGQLPPTFRLVATDEPQKRDGRTYPRWASTAPGTRTVLAEGVTRREVSVLIADAADWLSWDGTNR